MRRAAMLLLVALLVGALPAAAVPISMFPEPFVKAGTIYTSDGKATMAIIIGDKAATFDMIGAAMLAMKIGSHLYYTNAPYVNVDDAAAHGITLYYGGFDANSYYISITNLTMVNRVYNTTAHDSTIKSRDLYYCSDGRHPIAGNIYSLDDYVLMPLDNLMYPAVFHYILGEHVDDISSSYIVPNGTAGFYLQTGLIEFSNTTGDVNIPWLGFRLHVDNINVTKGGWIRMRVIAPITGATVAFINATNGTTFPTATRGKVTVVGDINIKVGAHKGAPVFTIGGTKGGWFVLPEFGVILANLTTVTFNQSAVTDEIATEYTKYGAPWGAEARFNTASYPVKGAWAVWNVSSSRPNETAYIWSKNVFPWFNGAVNAYFIISSKSIYVFNGSYGIGTWNFNETKRIGSYDFLFTSIGNRPETVTPVCPLTETIVSKEHYCTYICGECAGVYKIVTEEKDAKKLSCADYIDHVARSQEKATVYPRGATGVFAGIFDRFENVTGFKGTTQLKIETSGNITYAKDVTQPADVDQVFEGEAVFSFVKMPIIYLDSWVFVNNTLSDAVKDKDLILIGGPAVNTIVKYLNDAKLLDVTFKQVNGVWALEYAGKTYGLDTVLKILVDQGYLPAPISKEYVYRVEGGNGLGVVEYAKKNPFGSGNILVVAGTDRYGTLAASVALADPTKLASTTAPVFYAAGRTAPNAVILLGIKPTAVPPAVAVPTLTPVIVAIPAGAAG